jgi:hypothetical protein
MWNGMEWNGRYRSPSRTLVRYQIRGTITLPKRDQQSPSRKNCLRSYRYVPVDELSALSVELHGSQECARAAPKLVIDLKEATGAGLRTHRTVSTGIRSCRCVHVPVTGTLQYVHELLRLFLEIIRLLIFRRFVRPKVDSRDNHTLRLYCDGETRKMFDSVWLCLALSIC